MDTMTNRSFAEYDYKSRYLNVANYHDTLRNRDVGGVYKSMSKGTMSVSHKLTETDTLDSLALQYYANPTYWWVIAQFNNLSPFDNLMEKMDIIKIPRISAIEFKNLR